MIDKNSETWTAVAKWANDQITDAHTAIERVGLPDTEANQLRGRIAASRELLKLAEPKHDITKPFTRRRSPA